MTGDRRSSLQFILHPSSLILPKSARRAVAARRTAGRIRFSPKPKPAPGVGPASVYRLAEGNPIGRIGFISAMSSPFCATCNRLRLTADGVLRSCLFEGGEEEVRPILRGEGDPETRGQRLGDAMAECVRL